jgi:HEAT repeat protein
MTAGDVLEALGQTKNPMHIPRLIAALDHSSDWVRNGAALGLGTFLHYSSVLSTDDVQSIRQALISHLTDPDVGVRETIEESLTFGEWDSLPLFQ